MQTCDLILAAHWVAPVDGQRRLIENGAVVIDGGRIAAVDTQDAITAQWDARKRVDRPDALLTPGFVNAHTHAAMALFRGIADDVPLDTWLNQHIWPLEAQHVTPDFVRDGTRLAMAEMLRGGITCFNDMYFFPDVVAEAVIEARMRASIGLIVIDFPTVWADDPDGYLKKAVAVYDSHARHPLVSFQFAPHSPYAVSEETLARVRVQADQLDIGVHTHLHETAAEVANHVADRDERPFSQLDRQGFVNQTLLAAHMVHIDEDEIARAGASGMSVVHCPESNLKLASGMAPVTALVEAGVNVALGTDGAASNNDLCLIGEMRTAALLAKAESGNARSLPAETVLEMATINGARALGIDADTGSLEPGKWADITCIALDRPHTTPCPDPLSTLVYAAGNGDVSDVWVAGRAVLEQRKLVTIDEDAVLSRARDWAARFGTQNTA